MGNRIASRQLKFTLGNFFLFFVFFCSARFPILEDKNLIKMNYPAESGAVWLLLFALAIIRAANAVEETVVVENWDEAKDLCATAKAGHFVIRCKAREIGWVGSILTRIKCLPRNGSKVYQGTDQTSTKERIKRLPRNASNVHQGTDQTFTKERIKCLPLKGPERAFFRV